ncbi:hypothetical protein Pelo_18498 [Pelomyxa schiedti]|nr:hypothetical protein Pelo_18498 [Pelomyxa schiedti]
MLNSPSKITWTVVNCVACQLPSPSMQGTLQHTVEARLAKKAVLKTGSLELVMLSPPSAPPPSPITTPILSLSTASPQQSPSLPSAPPTVTASISTAALTSVPSSPRLASGSTTVCYMTLVECSGGCFVLCLLPPNGTTQQDMEKFRRELGSYCCEAVALKLLDDEGRLPQLKQYFSDWWIRCVLYLARCVEELSGHLAAFLYAVLFGKQLKFASEIPVDAVDDFERFLETISLVGRVQSETSAAIPATTTPSLIDDNSSSIQLGIASHTTTIMDETSPYTLSVTETNPFCQQWAVQMHLNKSSPIALQDLIEKMKMDVITELNQARKLIDQARHTHHALYKAYYHISNAELCEILLGLLAKAHVSELSNPGFSEVVEIICSHHYSKKSISNPALNSVLSTTSSSTASSTNTTPVVVPHKNTAAGGFGLQRVRMVPLL